MIKQYIISLLCGIVFGLGLAISEMVNPIKVKSFLDITGNWDPSLILVMISSITFTFISLNLFIKRLKKPIFSPKFYLPLNSKVDLKLIFGSTLFGIGWGLVGFCPGPSLAALSDGNLNTIYFVLSMIFGILAYRVTQKVK
ncbi:MAG: hypothetical protein CFH01_01013 [Alphaproteobacteria bacterium MarineAlpha2_Bin1]|nr:MAG: hypothetical protein CFH01_01013 [Alphaproteobacteria bacterium MarineAlpha2_Bin1]|tara:strand:+ start:1025 stop:1447 length:423 start_codon:yes stop_codon:yes gene_type:complete